MKKTHIVLSSIALAALFILVGASSQTLVQAATTVCQVFSGCTGSSAIPTAGQVLVGQPNGTYAPSNVIVASTTIGGGTQTTGLTISGGATTTENAYFAGMVNILDTTTIGIKNGDTSKFIVNANATALQPPPASTFIHYGQADGIAARVVHDAYGGTPNYIFRRANGTAASPSAVLAAESIGTIAGFGYGATAYTINARASITMPAAENWTDAAQGAEIIFSTTAIGTAVSPTQRMKITDAGNVGIGTTTPGQKLSVAGDILGNKIIGSYFTTTSTTASIFPYASSTVLTVSGNAYFPGSGIWNSNGNVGIGTTTPFAKLSLHAVGGETATTLFAIASSTSAFATTTHLSVKNDGTIYAPNTSSSGSAQTGYWCYDANGQFIRTSTTCLVSSSRFKERVGDLDVGLAEVMKLRPVSYFLKDTMGDPNNADQQLGFIAEEAQAVDPRLITRNSEGHVQSFRYEQFTALLTKAIQEQQRQIENLKVGAVKTTRTAEENWQWVAIMLLLFGIVYQQVQIKNLRK